MVKINLFLKYILLFQKTYKIFPNQNNMSSRKFVGLFDNVDDPNSERGLLTEIISGTLFRPEDIVAIALRNDRNDPHNIYLTKRGYEESQSDDLRDAYLALAEIIECQYNGRFAMVGRNVGYLKELVPKKVLELVELGGLKTSNDSKRIVAYLSQQVEE